MQNHEFEIPETELAHEPDFMTTREANLEALVEAGSISRKFAESGIPDMFAFNDDQELDTIKHILVGDERGGLHHLRTVVELEAPQRTAASMLLDKHNTSKTRGQIQRDQNIRANGTCKPRLVTIMDRQKLSYKSVVSDAGSPKGAENALSGSVMFPDDWSAEYVLCVVARAAQNVAAKTDIERQSITHESYEVGGVKVVAVTDLNTGKIIAGYPRYNG